MPRSLLTLTFLLPLVLDLTACATAPAPVTEDRVATAAGNLAAELVHRVYDPAQPELTCKVYHHVFAPDGRLLTKGEGGDFQHHRGLFVGWNKTRRGKDYFDFWHCQNGERQQFVSFAADGPSGAQTSDIDWLDQNGAVIVHERRSLRASELAADVTRLDLQIVLTAPTTVALDGDPQHSGQQFRALDLFAPADAAKVRYLRPQGAAAHGNDVWTECRWIAAILPLPEGPVTVLRVEDPHNPPATWSTRDYGRFGAMHRTVVRQGNALRLRYGYAIALGERDADWCAATAQSFATPD